MSTTPNNQKPPSLLQSAIEYLDRGFSIFPCGSDKRPLVKWEPYQKERATKEEVSQWWKKTPQAMIAVSTGTLSGVSVIDIDEPSGIDAVSKYLSSARVPTVKTPSGGTHLYFKTPTPPLHNNARLIPGCDFRGEGGYVIAPPSTNGSGKDYQWLPGLSLKDIAPPELPKAYIDFVQQEISLGKKPYLSDGRKMFEYGNRDESLFHTANCLVKGGMPEDEVYQILENLIISWGEPPDAKWIKTKIESALRRQSGRERNLTQEVRDLISVTTGHFRLSEFYRSLPNLTPANKISIRVILTRLVEEGTIERVGKEDGVFRRVENDEQVIDVRQKSTGEVKLWMPFGLQDKVKTMPKNIIVIGGTPNSGKTAFLLNVAAWNRNAHKVFYFTSEMGLDELQERIDLMKISRQEWESKIKTIERSSNFADRIRPEGLNIIDFLEQSGDDFLKTGEHIRQIWERLTTGICFIALQKRYGSDLPQGGIGAIEKARLALSFDVGRVKIVKGKHWRDGKSNPNGLEMEFKLVDGCNFIECGEWTKANEPVKVPSPYRETEKQWKQSGKRVGKTELTKEFERMFPQ